MLGVPDKALVQACKAILQQADAAKHDLQVLSCQHSQQLLKADGLQEQQSGSDSAGAPTTLPAGKTIPAAMTVCASASAAAVQSPCNQDPDSDEATNRVESQQHDDQDCSIAERGQSGGLSNSGMLDVVSQTVQPGPTARHMPKQSTLLDAMLEDKADLHSSLAVSSSCLPDAADTTAQPFDVGSPHQPPEQAPKRNTSRIDSLLDAMLA